jgi:hypothetical protein
VATFQDKLTEEMATIVNENRNNYKKTALIDKKNVNKINWNKMFTKFVIPK